ncbi:MAG: N-(5'-phosphoribosyl)anthranilate isomerase [Bellilinea sp.]|nr:MAG: N-(5'-phosphoribosyl)anthranilate isomerase [Bellilinea sp.]
MIVKICGITTLEDALIAVEAGADMLGFNFYPASPRYIHPEACARITEALQGSGVLHVGVFVNGEVEMIRQIMKDCRLDLAQLSGDEPPFVLTELAGCAFKALRPADASALREALHRYPARTDPPAYLLDAHHPALYGGSGRQVAQELAALLARQYPILLAGGLTPENVSSVIQEVHPYGVDVASGVEIAPGRKDPLRLRAFIRAAKQAFQIQLAQ